MLFEVLAQHTCKVLCSLSHDAIEHHVVKEARALRARARKGPKVVKGTNELTPGLNGTFRGHHERPDNGNSFHGESDSPNVQGGKCQPCWRKRKEEDRGIGMG